MAMKDLPDTHALLLPGMPARYFDTPRDFVKP